MDLKGRTNRVCMISARNANDLTSLAATHRHVAKLIAGGKILSCHDLSDGGLFVAAAEMCIASGKGLIVGDDLFISDNAFVEQPGRYLIELADATAVEQLRRDIAATTQIIEIGLVQHLRKITVTSPRERTLELSIDELTEAWRGSLDW